MLPKAFILIFIWISILLSPPAECYYKLTTDKLNEQTISESIENSNQDNLFLPTIYMNGSISNTNNIPIKSYTKLLTELARLEIVKIQKLDVIDDIEPDLFIENLIYANLKLRRLINTKNDLVNNSNIFNSEFIDENSNKIDDAVIANKIRKIDDELNKLCLGRYKIMNRNYTQTDRSKTQLEIVNIHNQIGLADRSNQDYNFKNTYSEEIVTNNRNTDNYEIRSREIEKINVSKSISREKLGEMPLIFRIMVDFVEFAKKNKVESFMYISIVMVILVSISKAIK